MGKTNLLLPYAIIVTVVLLARCQEPRRMSRIQGIEAIEGCVRVYAHRHSKMLGLGKYQHSHGTSKRKLSKESHISRMISVWEIASYTARNIFDSSLFFQILISKTKNIFYLNSLIFELMATLKFQLVNVFFFK